VHFLALDVLSIAASVVFCRVEAVSRTAIGVARVRARETERPDGLFRDPYAQLFASLGELPSSEPPSAARLAIAFQIIIRTRFYDDWLTAAAAEGVRQFVLLGAGLDTRAYRLEWPTGTAVYELDLPPVVEAKREVLEQADASPACRRTTIGVDLTGEWAGELQTVGFDATQPTAWLAEGLLVYLSAEQAAHILETATQLSTPGSQLATEAVAGTHERVTDTDTAATVAMWQGGLADGLQPWLTTHGWKPRFHSLVDVAAKYGRPTQTTRSESGFVTATR
jgi:methyltransferase (TIGR00027 family)